MSDKPDFVLRGLDSTDKLLAWLTATGHRNLVLRTADVFTLAPVDQEDLAELLVKAMPERPGPAFMSLRMWYQNLGRYIVTPTEAVIERLQMKQIERLQEILSYYIEGRRSKGEPSKTAPCDCTDNGRKAARQDCNLCGGEGRLHVLLEMDEEEKRLTEGR